MPVLAAAGGEASTETGGGESRLGQEPSES